MDAEKSPASAHHENPKEGEFEEQLGHLANQEDHESGRWAAIKFVEFRWPSEIVADLPTRRFVGNVRWHVLGAYLQCGRSFW